MIPSSKLINNIIIIIKVAVWNSGILLTRLLDKLNNQSSSLNKKSFFKDKTVLELGCGTGLASIATAKFGASSVLATDSNLEVLDLAQRNIERNFNNQHFSNNNNLNDNLNDNNNINNSIRIKTVPLQWGLMDAIEYENFADIIIGSDLTYNSGSWMVLAETMSTILKPGGIVIYLVSLICFF